MSYEDLGAQLGGSYSSAVQRMQQTGTDMVISCMQESDNITMARDIQQYGLKVTQLWLNGYDRSLLSQYSSLMSDVYLGLSGTVPYEAATIDNTYPGMKTYIKEMNKYEPAFTYNGVSLQGWQSAALLADALKQAGRNFTQADIVNITNHFTANNSGGVSTVTNWETAHTTDRLPVVRRHRPGPGQEVRARLRQGEPGLRLPGQEREEPGPGAGTGRYAREREPQDCAPGERLELST